MNLFILISNSFNYARAAVPIAKEKLASEIERRSDFNFDTDESDKLAKSSPSRVNQIVNFLKEKKAAQVNVSIVFREQE